MICLEMDANAKVGLNVIKNDPNEMSQNGEYLLELTERNNLVICNATEECIGVITRARKTINGTEKSVIDYFIICHKLYTLLSSMKIDENRSFCLSRYVKKKGKITVVQSDHNLLKCVFNLKWSSKLNMNANRHEIFNFKNPEGIKIFQDLTSSSTLSRCFKNGDLIKESNIWLKEFKNIMQRSFKKIRITQPRQNQEIISKMREKASLLETIETLEICLEIGSMKCNEEIVSKMVLIKTEIEELDIFISSLSSSKNVRKIKEHYSNLTTTGSFCAARMWGLKRKLNLSSKNSDMPTAKKDAVGNLVTSKTGLLKLYKNTYVDRLAPKKAKVEYENLQKCKENLFETRYSIASLRKSPNWTIQQIEKVCKTLKNSKARDEHGMVYELFKPPYAGKDVYQSLTKMFNEMKTQLEVPRFFESMSITSIFKNKGSRSEISNERGIFNLGKVRSLLDKVIYGDTYSVIDSNLSFSNVGGRKARNIRDHLLVIYAAINDVINGNAEAIDIQGYDIRKCFDEMGYEEALNDLWDVGVNDDKFALIAKLDQKAKVVVKTPCGVTESFDLNRIVMQGSVFGPIKCSVQMDTLGRDCLANGDGIYRYKDAVDTPALAMIDDVIGVSKCSDKSVELNSIINVKIESKKLSLSESKCFKLHISKKSSSCSSKLKAHEQEIKQVKTATYLGDVVSEDGSIDATIDNRKIRSIGIISQISSVLNSISLGFFYMDIALTLRESMLVNGILTNSEVWYNTKEEHLRILENKDNELMRKIFDSHPKTASELYFIETAKLPLRFVISKRKFMYLWHILTRSEEKLI